MHNNMLPLCFLRLYKYQFIEAIYSSMAEMRALLEKQGYVALPYEYPNGFDEPEEDQRDDCLYVCVGGNMSIQCGDARYHLECGDALSVPGCFMVKISSSGDCAYYYCI